MKIIRRSSTLLVLSAIFCIMLSCISQSALAETVSISTISSFAALKDKIETAPTGTETVIEVSSDIIFTEELTINDGQIITIHSSGNTPYKLTQSNGRHFKVSGSLTLTNVIIDGDTTGGGIEAHDTLVLLDGAMIQNCYAQMGGGVYLTGGSFSMAGGTITQNTALLGGGIYVSYGSADISGGEITGNTATRDGANAFGGGICIQDSTVNLSGNVRIDSNTVIGNNKSGSGGGICALAGGKIYVSEDVEITNNRVTGTGDDNANNAGGGISVINSALNVSGNVKINGNKALEASGLGGGIVTFKSPVTISGNVEISNNTAESGGGIYAIDTDDLSIGELTVFSGNIAALAYAPPDDALNLYPNIRFASVSISTHPLNNYDINYTNAVALTYNVTYDPNGGAGGYTGPDIIPGDTDTVLALEITGIDYADHSFVSWNTLADGSGTSYAPGDEIVLYDSIVLYAIWAKTSDLEELTDSEDPSDSEPSNPKNPSDEAEQTTPDIP